ncbi:TonB family protein [Paracoccus rhizosphaerae]|uniref:TonB family protein n=1 Tax=Paracoccus rhizosphaerae TaxID=1133347 RepID=A0ABV6CJI3_9RHOB|nr:TonB family protein [Paracoccus rhizosphaerae]
MDARRTLETAAFFTIAAALHVSAAAMLLPDQAQKGAAVTDAPPAALSAGGEEVRSMVSEWEAPPEVETAAEPVQAPQPPVAEAPEQVRIEKPPILAAAPALAMPEAPAAQPNLPEPPEPAPIDPAQLDLPDLQPMTPPRIDAQSQLALDASARPERRPERQPEPRRQPAPEPQRQQMQERAPAPVQPAQQAGQGGQSQASSQGGGGGGINAAARANAVAHWGGQIRSCISRRTKPPRGLRQGGTVTLALNVGRNGVIQGIGIAASSGQPALDQAVAEAARRVGRCPAAPAALTDSVYPFTLPIRQDVR